VLARTETNPVVSARCFFVCGALLLLFTNGANGARYQRTQDGKTLIWNNLRGIAQQATWSGARDSAGYATGEGTLTWYRLGSFVNSYTGKMVQGKFDGPVIREQGQTRFQTTFANGNKVGNWSEPGSAASRTPAPTPKGKSIKTTETQPTEEPLVEQPSPLPMPSPSPTSTPSPSPRFSAPSPVAQPAKKASRLEEVVEGPVQDSLELASPSSSLRNALEEVPWVEASPSAPTSVNSPTPSPTAIPQEAESKNRMIAEFKEQTESVLVQVRDATANFREIDRLDAVVRLPASVSASVASLANRARDFRSKLGYEIAFHESRAETEIVDALTVVDQVTRSLAGEDAPAARLTLLNFLKRYPEPPGDNQKPLWRYLTSALSLCDRSKNEAEAHLKRAQSLGSAGKKSEALREYQEIYRIYSNPVTAEKIRQLEGESR